MRSIRSKILVSILLITLVTSSVITSVFYQKSAQMIEENYISMLRQRGRQTVDTMDQVMQNVYHINVNASCDEELKKNILSLRAGAGQQALERLSALLHTFRKQNTSISSVYLLIPEESLLVTSEEYPMYKKGISEDEVEEVIQEAGGKNGPVILRDPAHEDSTILSFMEAVEDTEGKIMGYLFSNIEERYLYYNFIAGMNDGTVEEAVILNQENQTVTALGSEQIGSVYDKAVQYAHWLEGGETAGTDEENIYIYCKALFSQCSLFIKVEKSVVLADLLHMRGYLFGNLAFFLLLSLIPAFYLTRVVYKPLKRLMAAMRQVSDGKLDTRAEIVSKDEIGTLALDFNQMLQKIEELIHKLLTEEHLKKDAELEALQYQITPHFMYNTLSSIECAALIKGEKELGRVIGDFVELLQASIRKKGAFLTVAEEIHILENYIRLQEFRQGEPLEVSYEIEPDTQQCRIPRLILQPLVENSLLHGMDRKERRGKLTIQTEIAEHVLCLKVIDNGRGMTREQIDALLNSKVKKTKGLTAIGIPNIRDRLKLYYGDGAGITYESSENGTAAIIHMPVITDEK